MTGYVKEAVIMLAVLLLWGVLRIIAGCLQSWTPKSKRKVGKGWHTCGQSGIELVFWAALTFFALWLAICIMQSSAKPAPPSKPTPYVKPINGVEIFVLPDVAHRHFCDPRYVYPAGEEIVVAPCPQLLSCGYMDNRRCAKVL